MGFEFPEIVIERHGKFNVVRDDLHPGGTKQIVLRNLLPELNAKHFVYVASAFGKGGAALAYTCAELGFDCTLFMARASIQPDWIADVQSKGTKIIWQDLSPVTKIEPKAHNHALQSDAQYMPLGFDTARFYEILRDYAQTLPFAPQEIWCPIVSGTMARGLEFAFPDAAIKGVSVVKHHDYTGFGQVFHAPEKFIRGAAIPPPYPSWPYSDAKVWRFAQKHGIDDAVIWNSNA